MIQERARRRFAPIDFVIIAAFCFPPLVAAIDELLGLSPQAFPVLILASTALFAVAALVVTNWRDLVSFRGNAGVFLGLFLLLSVVSSLRADLSEYRWDAPAMWRQLLIAMAPAALFWTARGWAGRDFNPRAVDFGAMILLGVCASSILLEITGYATYEAFGSRYFGFLGDQVAWLLSFLVVYFISRGKIGLFALAALVLLLTQSRGALLVAALGVGCNFALSRGVDTRTRVVRIAMLVVGGLILFAAQEFFDSFLRRFSQVDLLENDRTRTIAFTLEVFQLRPGFGSGYNAHTYYFMPRAAFVNYTFEQWATPVSTWTQILADAGIAGVIPFALWAYHCSAASYRALRMEAIDDEADALRGLAAWILPFLLLNHTAAWLLPSSLMSPLLFMCAGTLVGRMTVILSDREPFESQAAHA